MTTSYSFQGQIDLYQLQNMLNQTNWAHNRSIEDIELMMHHSDEIIHVFYDHQLVGFARILTDYVFRATIWDVVVEKTHHGKGVGRLILEHILSHPKLKRVPKFWLFTKDKQPFYEKFGFVNIQGSMVLDR